MSGNGEDVKTVTTGCEETIISVIDDTIAKCRDVREVFTLRAENIARQLVKIREMAAGMIERQEQDSIRIEKADELLNQCRNELCLMCDNYKEAHNGACDGCLWKDEWRK